MERKKGKKSTGHAGTLSHRYSGPVKSSYRSPQTVMHLKKSAFLPGPGCHDLLSNHMENHYRRIAAVGAVTDTSAPESLLKCTKVWDQRRRRSRSTCTSRCSTISHISGHSSRATLASRRPMGKSSRSHTSLSKSDAGFVSMTESLESLQVFEESLPDSKWDSPREVGLRQSTPEGIHHSEAWGHPWLSYGHLLDSPVDKERKWQLYHTRTGQLTGYKHYKQGRASPVKEHSTPWKPAFNSNSPLLSSYPSLSSEGGISTHKKKRALTLGKRDDSLLGTHTLPHSHIVKSAAPPSESKGEGGGLMQPEEGTCHNTDGDVHGTVDDQRTHSASNDYSTVDALTPHTASDAATAINGYSLSPHGGMMDPSMGKEIMWRTAELREQSQISERRSQAIRKRVDEKVYESQCLEFISGVTRDILARGVLSDSAMALLFRSHIERNKDRLQEDVMLERIQLLKKELGVTI